MVSGAVRVQRRDAVVATATAVVALLLLSVLPGLVAGEEPAAAQTVPALFSAGWWPLAAVLVGQAAALLTVRRVPRTTVGIVAALAAGMSALGPTGLHGLGGPALVVAVGSFTAFSASRLWPTLTGAVLAVAAGEVVGGFSPFEGLLQALTLVGLPALVGLLVRSRRDVRQALLRERDALVKAALSRERTAMARELHDVAAHHLSGIALMAAVVDRQIDHDPQSAHEGARQIRAQSTDVLDDLRRLVGLLREGAAAELSVESLAAVADLVRPPTTLRLRRREGFPLGAGLGPLGQLAAYRAVQEALSNAALHAPGADCSVEVDDSDPTRVVVRVENSRPRETPGPRVGGGFGLRGMAERAELVGGRLGFGPTAGGGWFVELEVARQEST